MMLPSLALVLPLFASLLPSTHACCRVTYKNRKDNHSVLIGRSVDFAEDDDTAIWAFPTGTRRNGGVVENSYSWRARYGSATAVMYDRVFVEGVNTKGLTGSTLFVGTTEFGDRDRRRSGISAGVWMQYFLDMYGSVAEAAQDFCPQSNAKERFQVAGESLVPGIESKMHIALSDMSGDNLIMEYVKGRLQCHHSRNYTVVTGDNYHYRKGRDSGKIWDEVKNYQFPEEPEPKDRFRRLYFFNHRIQPANDLATAIGNTMGMMRAVSNPMTDTPPGHAQKKDLWPTQWRMYTDPGQGFVLYESATTPLTFTYSLNAFDQHLNGKVLVLKLADVVWDWRKGNGDMSYKFRDPGNMRCPFTQLMKGQGG
ncbi:hypothetical protein ACJ41O_010111 [Fusarium nematophilum]